MNFVDSISNSSSLAPLTNCNENELTTIIKYQKVN